MTTLPEIFEHELKDLFSAESQLIAALPKMKKAASTPELAQAFETHLAQTREQKARLQEIAKMLDTSLGGHTCKAMQGLIEEGSELMEEFEPSPARDAALIAAAQRVEHYEISAYGSACALAKALGHNEVAALLDKTLQEEGDTDKLLTEISLNTVVPSSLKNGSNGSSSGNGAPAMSREELEAKTRDALYQLAQEREIEGRSQMDKQQLIKALAG
jgi:ferritin-like metal-binding protein YciE